MSDCATFEMFCCIDLSLFLDSSCMRPSALLAYMHIESAMSQLYKAYPRLCDHSSTKQIRRGELAAW